MNHFKANFLGSKANEILESSVGSVILGTTSRGVFLEISTGWIVFLSLEQYRGPLTINLSTNTGSLNKVQKGMIASVDRQAITFPQAEISILLHPAEIWTPPPPPLRDIQTNSHNIRATITGLDDPFLSTILEPDSVVATLSDIQQRALEIYAHMQSGDWQTTEESALSLLGRGTGLTPEGDDFLTGLCFSLARIGSISPVKDIIQTIVQKAYERTTRMSANLIEIAAEGLADERLVSAYDTLLTGSPDAQSAVQTLLGWGSTSGRMALAGITTGILSTR